MQIQDQDWSKCKSSSKESSHLKSLMTKITGCHTASERIASHCCVACTLSITILVINSRWKGNFDGKIPVKRSQPYPSGSLSPWKDLRQDSPVKWSLHVKVMDINTVPQRLICSCCSRWCRTSPMEGLATLGPWLSPPWASLTLYCAPPSFIHTG